MGKAEADGELQDEGYRRMLAADAEVHRLFFSAEAMANEYPADAPELLGGLESELVRDASPTVQ
jgi:hypothetical protein